MAFAVSASATGSVAPAITVGVATGIAAALTGYTALAVTAGLFLRPHHLTPLVTSHPNLPASAWIMSQWWTRGGTVEFAGQPPMNVVQRYCPPSAIGPGKPSSATVAQCLSQHGYLQWTRYQPASRFWPFQFIETGWLLVLSLVLIGASAWLVRRRAA